MKQMDPMLSTAALDLMAIGERTDPEAMKRRGDIEQTLASAGININDLDPSSMGRMAMGDTTVLDELPGISTSEVAQEQTTQFPDIAQDSPQVFASANLWDDEAPAAAMTSTKQADMSRETGDRSTSLDNMEAKNDRSIALKSHTGTTTEKDLDVELQAKAAAAGHGTQEQVEANARYSGSSEAVDAAMDKAALQTAGAEYMMNAQPGESVADFNKRMEDQAKAPNKEEDRGMGGMAATLGTFMAFGTQAKEMLNEAIGKLMNAFNGSGIDPNQQGQDVALANLGNIAPAQTPNINAPALGQGRGA